MALAVGGPGHRRADRAAASTWRSHRAPASGRCSTRRGPHRLGAPRRDALTIDVTRDRVLDAEPAAAEDPANDSSTTICRSARGSRRLEEPASGSARSEGRRDIRVVAIGEFDSRSGRHALRPHLAARRDPHRRRRALQA